LACETPVPLQLAFRGAWNVALNRSGRETDRGRVRPRLDGVQHQVREHLLRLHAIRPYVGDPHREVGANRDRVRGCLLLQQDGHFANQVADIYALA
jgi:hypothetical protein